MSQEPNLAIKGWKKAEKDNLSERIKMQNGNNSNNGCLVIFLVIVSSSIICSISVCILLPTLF
jgi:hypothetical protein